MMRPVTCVAEESYKKSLNKKKQATTGINAFISAKAKEQVLIKAPKTKDLIVYSRPVNQLLTNLPKNKQGQEEIIKPREKLATML